MLMLVEDHINTIKLHVDCIRALLFKTTLSSETDDCLIEEAICDSLAKTTRDLVELCDEVVTRSKQSTDVPVKSDHLEKDIPRMSIFPEVSVDCEKIKKIAEESEMESDTESDQSYPKSNDPEFPENMIPPLDKNTSVITASASMRVASLLSWDNHQLNSMKRISNATRNSFMLMPLGPLRLCWNMIMVAALFFVGFMIPFYVGFPAKPCSERGKQMVFFQAFVDVIFLFDIVVTFRTGYMNNTGKLIMDWRRVGERYLRSWFLVDFIFSFPFDWILMQGHERPSCGNASIQEFTRGQYFQLIKLGRLLQFAKRTSLVSAVSANTDRAHIPGWINDLMLTKTGMLMYKTTKVCLLALLLCHLLACCMARGTEGFLSSYPDDDNAQLAADEDISTKYLICMYWALTTITTVGYGDILPTSNYEISLTMFGMVVGCTYYAYVIALISSIVGMDLGHTSAYFDRMEVVTNWANSHHMEPDIRREIQLYFRDVFTAHPHDEEQGILKDMPPDLRRKVGAVLIPAHVRLNYLFDDIHASNLAKMVSIIKFVHIQSGEGNLVEGGEVGHSLFIIQEGEVKKRTARFKRIAGDSPFKEPLPGNVEYLKNGDSFGEEVALGLVHHYGYTVMPVIKTTLHMIPANDLQILFAATPDILERMKENFRKKHKMIRSKKRISTVAHANQIPPGFPDEVLSLLKEIRGNISGRVNEVHNRRTRTRTIDELIERTPTHFNAAKDEILRQPTLEEKNIVTRPRSSGTATMDDKFNSTSPRRSMFMSRLPSWRGKSNTPQLFRSFTSNDQSGEVELTGEGGIRRESSPGSVTNTL